MGPLTIIIENATIEDKEVVLFNLTYNKENIPTLPKGITIKCKEIEYETLLEQIYFGKKIFHGLDYTSKTVEQSLVGIKIGYKDSKSEMWETYIPGAYSNPYDESRFPIKNPAVKITMCQNSYWIVYILPGEKIELLINSSSDSQTPGRILSYERII